MRPFAQRHRVLIVEQVFARSLTGQHALVVVGGTMIDVDEQGKTIGYEDVHGKTDMFRAHCAKNGLGATYVEQFVR